jgi:hypothetical protein
LFGLGEISRFNSERIVLSPTCLSIHNGFRHCLPPQE